MSDIFKKDDMENKPVEVVKKLVKERYKDAKAVFWAGSVSQGAGTESSDLDLVIIFEALPSAYREAFLYEEWPIDAFVHDEISLQYFFEESRRGNGISGLVHMVLYGQEITPPSPFSHRIKAIAEQFLQAGPQAWNHEKIDMERFLITDVLEDIIFPKSRAEQLASTAWLYEALAQFYFRAQTKWCSSGKAIVSYLKQDNPNLAEDFLQSFEQVFQSGETVNLEKLTQRILAPYGGLMGREFKAIAPAKTVTSAG